MNKTFYFNLLSNSQRKHVGYSVLMYDKDQMVKEVKGSSLIRKSERQSVVPLLLKDKKWLKEQLRNIQLQKFLFRLCFLQILHLPDFILNRLCGNLHIVL